MLIFRKIVAMTVLLTFAVALLTVGGCTKYASQDDLNNLDEAKKAAVSAERELEGVKAQRADLEKQVQVKEAELKKKEDELQRLRNQ